MPDAFAGAVRISLGCEVATVPAVHGYGDADPSRHSYAAVMAYLHPDSQPLMYVPFQRGDGPEIPDPLEPDFATNGEIAVNMSTAPTTRIIGP